MSSKRNTRNKSCSRKVRYQSLLDAENAAYFSRKRTDSWIMAYSCKFCGGFHIGHPPSKVKQSIRDKRGNNEMRRMWVENQGY